MSIQVNNYQTQLTDELLNSLHPEVRDQLLEAIANIKFIQRLIDPNRKFARDLDRDKDGKIIVDILNPHILEDMDYFRPTAKYYEEHGVYTHLRPNSNPNSDFGKWFKQEIERIWYGMIRESDGEWIPGQMYWYLNYTPIIKDEISDDGKTADRVEGFPDFWEGLYWWFHYIHQARYGGLYNQFEGGQHAVQIAKRQAPHPYSSNCLTTEGWKKWKDVKVGDYVYSKYGKPTLVINEIEQGKIPIYKLTFLDGREVFCGKDHLWELYRSKIGEYKSKRIISVGELIENGYYNKRNRESSKIEYKYSIKTPDAIEFDYKKTKIEPYTFGLLLGDGTFRLPKHQNTIHYTSSEKDICVYKKHIPYNIRKRKSKYGYSIDIEKIGTILKEYGLYMKKSEDKFIPKEYLFNSRENRLNILKGLMDSDGTVSKSVPSICTSSKQLNDDILFLVRSLGINAKSTLRKTFFNGRQYKDSFEITIYTDEIIFNLPRKINKLSKKDTLLKRSKIDYTTLINIEYSHDEEAKCITILDPESIYLIEDFIPTHNSKSYSISALLSRLFVVGDSPKGSAKTRGVIMAHDKEKLIKDGTLNKFLEAIDFQAKNTEFPSARIKSTLDGMQWKMGYKDKISGIERGTLNEIMGSAINDDVDKIRGKRAQLLVYEEFGAFPKFLDVWNTNRRSVQSGNIAFGQAIAIGTGGSEGANFYGALQMIYSPKAYNVYALPNYYDRSSNGNGTCVFFFGAYINRPGYMNRDGVSDVTGALIEIFRDRYNVKYNATDTLTLTRVIAEDPITIQEAIMRREGSIFPSAALNDRLNEIKTNPHILDDVYVGMLKQNSNGEIEFDPTIDAKWIKHYPHQDNKIHGAVAIFKMPEKDNTGKVFGNRYILASDPFDSDTTIESMSLGAIYVLDLWTDKIVAEYVGRPQFADEFYEICRKLCLFYCGSMLYESNLKGTYSYFSRRNCLYLLNDLPQFLKDRDLVKGELIGNSAKGVRATLPILQYGIRELRDWLLKDEFLTEIDSEGNETITSIPNLMHIKSPALLEELIQHNSENNFDRVSAMIILMLLRQEKLKYIEGKDQNDLRNKTRAGYLGNDPFFKKNGPKK